MNMHVIDSYKMFENKINDQYLIGLPSGQIIDFHYKQINSLKQDGLIVYNHKLKSYTFRDIDYIKILKFLKLPLPVEPIKLDNVINLDFIQDFFDNQKNVRSFMVTTEGVEVHGSIFVSGKNYETFPFKFKDVTGDFIFRNSKLTSLKNGPKKVGGHFDVSLNNLIDLIYGPEYVGKAYDCSNNKLITLKGAPENIKSDFDCSGNKLVDLNGSPRKVMGFFDCSGNPIKDKSGAPETGIVIHYGKSLSSFKLKDEGDGKYSW